MGKDITDRTEHNKQSEKEDRRLIRFDWAIKRVLRDKVNFGILEGLLSSLLNREIKILHIIESESNREYEENKQNRVDLLAQEADGSKIIVEVQNESEDAYFHRILFGTSRVISEYLSKGDNYDKITKIYSINIVYFNLGEGNDFVYHGTTEFHGLHNGELLQLSEHLKRKYRITEIKDIFPEYYILRANDFDSWSKVPLEQWMYFLSTSEIPEDADAPGLKEAREQLRVSQLSIEERNDYMHHLREMNSLRNMFESAREKALFEGRQEGRQEGLKEGRQEGLKEGLEKGENKGRAEEKRDLVAKFKALGVDIATIAKATGLSTDEIQNL